MHFVLDGAGQLVLGIELRHSEVSACLFLRFLLCVCDFSYMHVVETVLVRASCCFHRTLFPKHRMLAPDASRGL